MAAEVISAHGVQVALYDSMPTVGRKFLMAGRGGLNITHSEPFEAFVSRYGKRETEIKKCLMGFSPNTLREWARGLGIETFVGTSGRVFPLGMKASPLLRAWLNRLTTSGVKFYLRHTWIGWNADGLLKFKTPEGEKCIQTDAVVLALGGGSFPRLGANCAWVDYLKQTGAVVTTLQPANCGFNANWSAHFLERYAGQPIKSVVLAFDSFRRKGEFIVTKTGIEGGLIYAASALLRDAILAQGQAVIQLDLVPDKSEAFLLEKLSMPRGARSMAYHLEKTVGIYGVKAGLLRECVANVSPTPRDDIANAKRLAFYLKHIPVTLIAARPLETAISTAGGVTFESLSEHLMLGTRPGVFCAGEMLDWEAPTGGYLLTACFASGSVAGKGVLNWLGRVGE